MAVTCDVTAIFLQALRGIQKLEFGNHSQISALMLPSW